MPRLVETVVIKESQFVEREAALLARYAMHSVDSAGRAHPEVTHIHRGPYQRDRDRVLHSVGFRRLSGKTQVFTGQGDYHRTRLTHTMEVTSIARTIARALRLNEDLVEALALLHDIGHPPFGHAGEDALNEFAHDVGGFSHNQFALTLVEEIEQRYPEFPGLNLTYEVLGGQGRRVDKVDGVVGGGVGATIGDPSQSQTTLPARAPLLEVQVVDLADSLAYNAHDVDDAVELGWLDLDELLELPILAMCHVSVQQRYGALEGSTLRRALVHELINLQVAHLILESERKLEQVADLTSDAVCEQGLRLDISGPIAEDKRGLERFLYQRLYRHDLLVEARRESQQKIKELGQAMLEDKNAWRNQLPPEFQSRYELSPKRCIVEFLASMTDHSFLQTYRELAG